VIIAPRSSLVPTGAHLPMAAQNGVRDLTAARKKGENGEIFIGVS